MDEDMVLGLYVLAAAISAGLLWLLASRSPAKGTRSSLLRLAAGNALVLALLLSLLAVAGEVYFRFFYDTTDSVDYTRVSQRWFQRHWQVNSSNCRDNINYSLKLPSGKRRITFVGDSFTAGHGVKDVEARFANRIRRDQPGWEVHLLAQPGMDTGSELTYLRNCLNQGYQVDEVVLVYCLNDAGDLRPEWTEAAEAFQAEEAKSGWLRRNSYLVNTLYYRIVAQRSKLMQRYFSYMTEGYRGDNWNQQRARLRELRDLIEAHGGQLMVVTFPFFQGMKSGGYEYQPLHDQLNQCWQELNVPHLDLMEVYRGLDPRKLVVSRFDAHPNEHAHALAAAAIEKFIRDKGRRS